MRIGIDARLFGPRVGGGGLGRYVEELVRHLEKIDHEHEYVIFLRKENWNDYTPSTSNFRKVLAPWCWYTIGEQFGMPWLVKREKIDLLHVPHFNIPVFSHVPLVVTIHDLILLAFPSIRASTLDPIRFWLKYIAYRFTLSHALRKARAIITVSNATRTDILKRFRNVAPEKITTIYSGFSPVRTWTEEHSSSLLKKPYLIAVGNAFPHKNLDGLLRLFYAILHTHPNLTLVITGPDDAFRARLRAQVVEMNLSKRVVFTGFVSEEELDALYRNAIAFVTASHLEGFSFPGLEAQMRNVPVIASDIPAHREVFHESAIYFKSDNSDAFGKAVFTVLNEPNIVSSLIASGAKNYLRFSWDHTTRETLTIYNRVLQSIDHSHGKEKTKTNHESEACGDSAKKTDS